MGKSSRHVSLTPATKWLRAQGVAYTEQVYDYVDHGGAAWGAQSLGLALRAVIKTLVMQDEAAQPLIVLMHGDCEVSTKRLARAIGARQVEPCRPEVAQRHSGYLVGGTSPFGLRKAMPIYGEASVRALDRIYINGGRRGYLLGMSPAVLDTLLQVRWVDCAQ
ncbi:MAG: aminoacyl-tRNA deacylase [Thiomonas sp.]|uniref:aminoacyl-tRNA deacylase n=1 Tax=Thiomonas sp. TaxID=2047785 RepID=UPI002A35FE8B|nr:aminoacyl-tRNA deacylase [Thiomonas sp.]MDY0330993.1 aminoacyl-tRNA deacylase [Thiomonas sp.]